MARESFAETFAEAALQALPGAVVVVDQDGRIQRWAGTAEELTGYAEDDVRGEPVRRVLAGPSWQELQELTGLLAPTELVAKLKRREGPPLPVAVSLAPLREAPGGGPLEATVLLLHPRGPWAEPEGQEGQEGQEADKGEQPHWEWQRALGAAARRLVAEAGHDLNAIDDTQQLAGLLIEQARQLLPATEVLIGMVPAERQDGFLILAGTGSWGRTMVGREIPRAEQVAGRSLEQSRPIETMRLQPDRGGLEVTNGSARRGSAFWDVLNTVRLVPFRAPRPLPDGRQLLGVVGWYRRTDSPFSPHERRLIDEFSSLVGAAIQRTELRRCAADAASRLQVGVEVAIDLASSLQREDVTQRLIRGAVEAVGAELGAVLEVDGQTAVVEQTTADDPPLTLGLRFPLDAVVAGDRRILLDTIERRQAVTADGFQYVVGSEMPVVSRAKHVLLLPIVVGDGVTAVLMTGRATDRPFYDHEVATARLIGNVAGLAMRNARLFSDTVAASRAKSDFLTMAAYELRAPLAVVSGYLAMLRDGSFGDVAPDLVQPLDLLGEKAAELTRLVDDLIVAARLEAGRLPARRELLDLRDVAAEAVRRAQGRAALIGAGVTVEAPNDPLEVRADREHLGRILDNLVNNALTYARPDHAVQVLLNVEADGEEVVATVADRGRGIAPEMHARVFERFIRVEDPESPQPGTGLGLFISRQLAAGNGGLLELEWSEPGEGSRFALRLKRADA